MVFGEKFTKLVVQLWKCPYNDSIIHPRNSSTHERMDGRYAERFEQVEDRNHLRFCSIESNPKARTRYKRTQSACYNFLERPNGVLSVSYHFTLFGLVVVGLVFAVLESMDELKHDNGLMIGIYILEVFLLVIFTSEYILRMWSAGCRSTYSGVLGHLRFAFKPFVIVDMIVIGSTFGVIIYSSNTNLSSSVSILRFFQVLRLVRFDRQGGSWKLLGSVLFLHRQELMTTFYIGFCSLIFASFFVYQAERVDNETEFGTFADSFWWGVVTLTTVGYGDKVPKSWAGRCVAAFFAIMGISFFALPAGILGSGFALKVSQHQRQKHVKRRRRPAAMLIQCNWRYYASQKNSKLVATWSPFIKYIQERNSRKNDNQIFEKPSQPVARVRKISIFGRKSSGLSSDGLSRPAECTTPEQARRRNRKVVRSELFHSNDSLHDGHSYSTGEQHTDDEHDGSHENHKPVLVTDADGNPSLPAAYKQCLRFTRYLKFLVALRKFKLAKKPYDVKDVIEQYSTGHVEVLGKVKSIGNKIDEALGYKVGTEKVNENPPARTNLVHRLSKLEKQVKSFENKLDQVISLLENCKRKDMRAQFTEERQSCSMCGHSYESCHEQHKRLQSKETKLPVRRRKFGVTLSNQSLNNHGSFSEKDEIVSNQETELRTRASLRSGENMDGCFDDCDSSVKLESDSGLHYLSPSCGILDEKYNDGANYISANSRQSSTYGISDNCPSPNPSSSDESYQSKGTLEDSHHDDHKCLVPNDAIQPLYGEGYGSRGHETFGNAPVHDFMRTDHEMSGKPRYAAPNECFKRTMETFPSHHLSSSDLGIAIVPSQYRENDHGSSANYGQIPDDRIPILNYQSPRETDQDFSPSNCDVDDSVGQKHCNKITGDDALVELGKSNSHDQVPDRKILLEEIPPSGLVRESYPRDYHKASRENSQAHGERKLPDSSFLEKDQTNEKYLISTPFACDILYDTHPRRDTVSIGQKPCDELFQICPQTSDSELVLSNRTTRDNSSHSNDITRTPGLRSENNIQETTM